MEMYDATIKESGNGMLIDGVTVDHSFTKGKLKKCGLELSEEINDTYNPCNSSFYLKKSVALFDEEMVVQLFFEGMRLKMIIAEPAELFNMRNMMKLSGGETDRQTVESAFGRLKTALEYVMKRKGEMIREDNVQYYIYEESDHGIMIVNDISIGRVSVSIAY